MSQGIDDGRALFDAVLQKFKEMDTFIIGLEAVVES
jgi:hypothetical protein